MAIELEFVKTNCPELFGHPDDPVVFKPRLKAQKGGFTFGDIVSFVGSPALAIYALRRHKNIISVYNEKLTHGDYEWLYNESVNPVECISLVKDAKFHHVEVQKLYDIIIGEQIEKNKDNSIDYDKDYLNMITNLEENISELETDIGELHYNISESECKLAFAEKKTEEATQRAEAAERALAEAQAKLAEAKTQTTTPQEVVTVNTALWEDSCEAACIVIEQIAKNQERGIIKNDFLNRMRAASSKKKTCSGADKTAWKAFPDEYKNGPGFPKKVTVKKHELE